MNSTTTSTRYRAMLRFLLPLGYMAGIFLLSSIPDDGSPETFAEQVLQWATPELQNLLHVPLFGGLAAAWYWALQPRFDSRWTSAFLAFAFSTLYSFLDEYHQLHVPGRFGSLTDIALNQVGILLVLSIPLFIHRRSSRCQDQPTG